MIARTTHTEVETSRLAEDIGVTLGAGSLVLLSGDLGVGKTVLARALIRQLSNDWAMEVTSPTYTLCQTYSKKLPIAHFDLYRLQGIEELDELGWQEYLEQGCVIMEWPENCFDEFPTEALHISIQDVGEGTRKLEITASEETQERLHRSFEIREFLDASGMTGCKRQYLSGDASARSYEILGDGKRLLMNAPEMADGPIIKDGKPYSQIAHLAENVTAFVAVDRILRKHDVMAPEIFSEDHEKGLLILEHFGGEGIVDSQQNPIVERYLTAIEFLAHYHQSKMEDEISLDNGAVYRVPKYDREAMMIEASLFFDWYLPDATEQQIPREEFEQLWHDLISQSETLEQGLVLRDFHSPNILWLPENEGTKRIGVIDFQDALIGPKAYDVASVAQDARVDISADFEEKMIGHYITIRSSLDADFDIDQFHKAYAIMAALRTTKILGIFVRLDVRDNKPQYRKFLPKMKSYLKRNLKHPVLSSYRSLLDSVIEL